MLQTPQPENEKRAVRLQQEVINCVINQENIEGAEEVADFYACYYACPEKRAAFIHGINWAYKKIDERRITRELTSEQLMLKYHIENHVPKGFQEEVKKRCGL